MLPRPLRKYVCEYAYVDGNQVRLGPACARLPTDEVRAIIAHEHGHIALGHARERRRHLWRNLHHLWWLSRGRWDKLRAWIDMAWQHEFDADVWAFRAGYGDAMIRFLRRRSDVGDIWHPPIAFRVARLLQLQWEKDHGER